MLGIGNGVVYPNKQMHPVGVQFDRDSSQYINVGDDNSLSFGTGSADVAMSISMWIKVDLEGTSTSNNIGLMVKGDEYNFFIDQQWDRITFVREDASASGYIRKISANGSVTSDVWTHIVVTSDDSETASGITIYIDGDVSSLATGTGSYTSTENTSSDLRIGSSVYGSSDASGTNYRYTDGVISNVAMWNSKLSAGNVTTLFNGGREYDIASGLGTNLVAWWPLNEGTGTSAADGSSNSNTGTLTNGPTWYTE